MGQESTAKPQPSAEEVARALAVAQQALAPRRGPTLGGLVGVVALVALVLLAFNLVRRSAPPAPPAITSWQGVSIYGGSAVAEDSGATVKLYTPGDPATVLAWYATSLRRDGFSQVAPVPAPVADGRVVRWQRGAEIREIAVGPYPGRDAWALVVIGVPR